MITVKSEKKAHVFLDRNKEKKKNSKTFGLLVTHVIKLLEITKIAYIRNGGIGESGIKRRR